MERWPNAKDHLFCKLMQMVSFAVCGEMETEPCCEEHKDLTVAPTGTEVRGAISEPPNELACGERKTEEAEELCGKDEAKTESCAEERLGTEMKSSSDPNQEGGETECKEQRKLRKTNSWKMVRFQDPSTDDDVLERDSSAESLFPEYAVVEWTSSTFEQLFVAEDWKDITGEDASVCSTSQVETHTHTEMVLAR